MRLFRVSINKLAEESASDSQEIDDERDDQKLL